MPYNNNPIPRPTNISGSVSLPLARVKKIINADEDINACSANAAFAIAVATEEFVYYLTEQAHKMAKAEKKPKRALGYNHIQQAVARLDNLEFLTDVVPKTIPYKEAKAERERKKAAQAAAAEANNNAAAAASNGQRTLPDAIIANGGGDVPAPPVQATAGAQRVDERPRPEIMDIDRNGVM
ncbi:DNA polymerase epsilon subunit 4 [Phyllosticta citriasiana]|uniref:DNA polymerase epsilon subunit 4 n=1 Tax=Phyllosticta citriasiana TaxID=595635 RepID=UPI0030FD578E